jgi:hypothetical protein
MLQSKFGTSVQQWFGPPQLPLSTTFSVVDEAGNPLPDRLVVIFLEGREAGRVDPDTGRASGKYPESSRTVPASVVIHEGQLLTLSSEHHDRIVGFAFVGDRQFLDPRVSTSLGELTMGPDGSTCVGLCPLPAVPEFAKWLMAAVFVILAIEPATRAASSISPTTADWPSWLRRTRNGVLGLAISLVPAVMFSQTGVLDVFVYKLTDIMNDYFVIALELLAIVIGLLTLSGHPESPRRRWGGVQRSLIDTFTRSKPRSAE